MFQTFPDYSNALDNQITHSPQNLKYVIETLFYRLMFLGPVASLRLCSPTQSLLDYTSKTIANEKKGWADQKQLWYGGGGNGEWTEASKTDKQGKQAVQQSCLPPISLGGEKFKAT